MIQTLRSVAVHVGVKMADTLSFTAKVDMVGWDPHTLRKEFRYKVYKYAQVNQIYEYGISAC